MYLAGSVNGVFHCKVGCIKKTCYNNFNKDGYHHAPKSVNLLTKSGIMDLVSKLIKAVKYCKLVVCVLGGQFPETGFVIPGKYPHVGIADFHRDPVDGIVAPGFQ